MRKSKLTWALTLIMLVIAVPGMAAAQTGQPTTHYVQLTFVPSASAGVKVHNLYRVQGSCPVAGSPSGLVKIGSTSTATESSYDDKSTLAGVPYCYIVRADNGFDESSDSNTTQAVIPLPPQAPSGAAAAVKK